MTSPSPPPRPSRPSRPSGWTFWARLVAVAVGLCGVIVAAGCGTGPAAPPTGAAEPAAAQPLDTSAVTPTGTWAVAVMGGSAARHNNFWQLFARRAGDSQWRLVTPPGTADNGGLVLASGGRTAITAFRPSQYLRFTPLIASADGGTRWTSLSPLNGPLARTPDALSQGPGGQLLALLTTGIATTAPPGAGRWRALVTRNALARTIAGRRCGLGALTAAAYSPAGTPLLGGACARPGRSGIFALVNGTWRATGPAMPAALAGRPVTVIRLTQSGGQVVALLRTGTGRASSLVAAWSPDGVGRWSLSQPLTIGAAAPVAAFIGASGIVVRLSGRRGDLASPGRSWQPLPTLPPGTTTLAAGPARAIDALAVHGTTLTIWRKGRDTSAWVKAQTVNVPIQYGSSG